MTATGRFQDGGSTPPFSTNMIICICRDIRESDFETEAELRERVFRDDFVCGKCKEYLGEDLDFDWDAERSKTMR